MITIHHDYNLGNETSVSPQECLSVIFKFSNSAGVESLFSCVNISILHVLDFINKGLPSLANKSPKLIWELRENRCICVKFCFNLELLFFSDI